MMMNKYVALSRAAFLFNVPTDLIALPFLNDKRFNDIFIDYGSLHFGCVYTYMDSNKD